jgi:hypothetical protein
VFYYTENGQMAYFPSAWTDAGQADPFVVLTVGQLRKTKAEIVAEIDRLLERCTDSEIAADLNKKGWRSSANQPFSRWIIYQLRTGHKLVSRTERLRAKGFLNARQIAALVGTKPLLVDYWRQQGLLEGIRLNEGQDPTLSATRVEPKIHLSIQMFEVGQRFWCFPIRRR